MIRSSSPWTADYCSGFGPSGAIGWLLACTRCGPVMDGGGRARREREVTVSRMYYAWHNDAQRA